MTIRELILLLQGCQQDMRVIMDGYEGGYEDVGGTETKAILLNYNPEWYYGPHEDANERDGKYDEKAILLFRAKRGAVESD